MSAVASPDESLDPQRFITVWCPDWPIVAAGRAPDVPSAVLRVHRVIARSLAAADDGVVVGHRRRQAQQRCPMIELLDDDPARDAREFESIVRAVADVAPRVELVEPGWLTVDARGPSAYFGGDHATAEHLVEVVRTALGRSDVPVGVGAADGRFAASVAARLAVRRDEPVVVDIAGSPDFCAELPVGWLQTLGEVDADMVDLFIRLGIRRLGDLAALEPADVLGRFGTEGLHAHRLASGTDHRPASTSDPAPERRLDRVLDDAAGVTDAVVFVAKQLADELAGTLAADGRVCTRLVVVLETEHGERSERSWYRAAGLTAGAMVERVRWQLDGWVNLPRGSEHEISGGVNLIRLTPDEVRADDGIQLGLWGGQSDEDRRAARTIARLTTLTSEQAVTVPVWQGGRLPTDRYRWVPATMVDLDQRVTSSVGVDHNGHGGRRGGGGGQGGRGGGGRGGGQGGRGRGGRGGGGGGPGGRTGVGSRTVRPGQTSRTGLGGVGPGADGGADAAPWPGSLPSPSPSTVYPEAFPCEVLDDDGEPVRVGGRGVLSATPASMCMLLGGEHEGWRRGSVRVVESWAGPWPVDQHWWDPDRHRRLARFQMITGPDERGDRHAVLVVAEHRRWWVVALYD